MLNGNVYPRVSVSGVSYVCSGICVLILLVMVMSLNIAELAISQQYLDDSTNTCHNDRLIKPALWLQWDGIIGFVEMGIILLTVLGAALHPAIGGTVACCLLTPAAIVQFAWIIIGCVSLWRDNLDCGPSPLHDCLWAACILHLLFLGAK